MSVLIREIGMPPNCYLCGLTNDGFYLCKATHPYRNLEDDCEERIPDWCPLVEVDEAEAYTWDDEGNHITTKLLRYK